MVDRHKGGEHHLATSHRASRFSCVGFRMARGRQEPFFVQTDTWECLNGKFNELGMICTHYRDHSHPFRALT